MDFLQPFVGTEALDLLAYEPRTPSLHPGVKTAPGDPHEYLFGADVFDDDTEIEWSMFDD
jgi:hypothetical protein